MRNACPTCETVYAVTPKDVGRRIVCKKCGATLVIDDDGFRVETPPRPAEPMPLREECPAPRGRRANRSWPPSGRG